MSLDRDEDEALARYLAAGGRAGADGTVESVKALAMHAPSLFALALGNPRILEDALSRPLARGEKESSFRRRFLKSTAALEDGPELRRVLRKLRHQAVVRITLREVLGLADVDRTSQEMASLAASAVDAALQACRRTVDRLHGPALGAGGDPMPLVVIGMGKLGGRELNLGSDIDICFFYDSDEGTVGSGDLTVHEHFSKVAARTSKALGEVTEDGFVFRVDLRLRPEGSSGPLVNSLVSAERYYETWGRDWERAALLRARPIAGDRKFGKLLLEVLRPFVFRRAVEPRLADAMVTMVDRARRDLGADEERDIKLGRGGIREAEFSVQALQLIWGGQHKELQVTGTVEAIRRLMGAGLLASREGTALEADWALLRRVEHRIHMRSGYQGHDLPEPGEERDLFARSLGFADGKALGEALEPARQRVRTLFHSLTTGNAEDPRFAELCERVAANAEASDIARHLDDLIPLEDPEAGSAHLLRLGRRARSPLGPLGRKEMPELGPMLLREVAQAADPDAALRFLAEFFGRLGGTWGYDRMLLDDPHLTRRLVGLFGASATLSQALIFHPEALGDVLVRSGKITRQAIEEAHQGDPFRWQGERPDPERFVHALRQTKEELTLSIGLALVGGDKGQSETEALLTILADAQIGAALRYAQAETNALYGKPHSADGTDAGMVVIALGKLGGEELGFGSDLDLMFLYDEEGETTGSERRAPVGNQEAFIRTAQHTLRLLSQPDAAGRGYETDARLRPSGTHGMLVVSLAAFDAYHQKEAAAWERQSLIRARPLWGPKKLANTAQERFDRLAYGVEPPLGEEVAKLRRRLELELSGQEKGRYHPKLGFGGLADVEFAVQWLQMKHGADPAVRGRNTLEALAQLSAAGYVNRDSAEALDDGFRFLRSVEQTLKLLDETREAVLVCGSRAVTRVARRLGIRDCDATSADDVLVQRYRRHAEEIRTLFEQLVGTIGTVPPWSAA